jgi:hypothetical protein
MAPARPPACTHAHQGTRWATVGEFVLDAAAALSLLDAVTRPRAVVQPHFDEQALAVHQLGLLQRHILLLDQFACNSRYVKNH